MLSFRTNATGPECTTIGKTHTPRVTRFTARDVLCVPGCVHQRKEGPYPRRVFAYDGDCRRVDCVEQRERNHVHRPFDRVLACLVGPQMVLSFITVISPWFVRVYFLALFRIPARGQLDTHRRKQVALRSRLRSGCLSTATPSTRYTERRGEKDFFKVHMFIYGFLSSLSFSLIQRSQQTPMAKTR